MKDTVSGFLTSDFIRVFSGRQQQTDDRISFPDVNVINILSTTFSFGCVLRSFSLVMVWLCIFGCKNICVKAPHKMLMKLTTDANFINILLANISSKSVFAAFL